MYGGEDAYLDTYMEDRMAGGPYDDVPEDECYHDERDLDEGLDADEECEDDPEARDWANGWGSDGDVDADALASAGLGTDEDYI